VLDAIAWQDDEAAKARIKVILEESVQDANRRMIGILTPEERRLRNSVALTVILAIAVAFALGMWRVMKTFAPPEDIPGQRRGRWQLWRYRWAYVILLPGVGTIALWRYYPLIRGMFMGFQDYRVMGSSPWVGLDNFANVLWDKQYWYALWVSTKYALMFMMFGFVAPIILALLLHEVPRGKILFRTIYYLPAVITGLVVMFLWKSFYKPEGLLNQFVNIFMNVLGREEVHWNWLDNPDWALICCLAPVVWAGAGPGCLIYLAALKTIPDEIYEAGDIDGATPLQKILFITFPSLKALIIINFVSAFVGAFKTAQLLFVMTGGGPKTPYGATETVGLQLFYTAFMYLKFGLATAMAWILGFLLIGFTVFQLQRLRNMEFRAAGSKL